jgi:RNA polymerase sigma factor (TIGR02999 family)
MEVAPAQHIVDSSGLLNWRLIFPMTLSHPDVTALLRAWNNGDAVAHDTLWTIVHDELRRLAHQHMNRERPDHTLQTSALVNEAYLRLVKWKTARWQNRAHFFGLCARIMRQILVDYARARGYQRRGGNVLLEPFDESAIVSPSKGEQLLALDEALTRLSAIQPRKGSVVELRFFGGFSVEETAELLGVSRLTVIRDWNFARAWLLAEMSGEISEPAPDV